MQENPWNQLPFGMRPWGWFNPTSITEQQVTLSRRGWGHKELRKVLHFLITVRPVFTHQILGFISTFTNVTVQGHSLLFSITLAEFHCVCRPNTIALFNLTAICQWSYFTSRIPIVNVHIVFTDFDHSSFEFFVTWRSLQKKAKAEFVTY